MTFHGPYGFAKTIFSVLLLPTFVIDLIESQPLRLAMSHLGLMIVFQVKTTSSTVIGLPSLQTAFGLILTSSVSGFFEMSCAGPAARSGTIEKFGFTM